MIDDISYSVAFSGGVPLAEGTYLKDLKANGKRGIVVTVDITAETGVATLDLKVKRKDQASGKFVDIVGGAIPQQSAIGTTELVIYPGVAETANVSVSDVISEDFQIEVLIGGTTVTLTFTVGVALIR